MRTALALLLIKQPRQLYGRIVRRHVRILDVMPTVAHLAHVRIPWREQGRSVKLYAIGSGNQLRPLTP